MHVTAAQADLLRACGGADPPARGVQFAVLTGHALDVTFGTGGLVTTPIGSLEDVATSMAIDGSGKIVVAGYTLSGGKYDFALARYNADGSRDTSFGAGGRVTTSFGSSIDAAWDKNLHTRKGNLVLGDGSVQQTKTEHLRAQISACLASWR